MDNRAVKLISTLITISLYFTFIPAKILMADDNTVFQNYPLEITCSTVSSWDNTSQYQLSLINVDDQQVTDWKIIIIFEDYIELMSIWNAVDISDEDTPEYGLTVGCESYNSSILPGESISFGMTVSGIDSAPEDPISILLVQDEADQDEIVVPQETEFAIFSGSIVNDLSISGWQTNIEGDIYSGKDFLFQGSELYMDGYAFTVGTVEPSGWITSMTGAVENILPVDMPDFSDLIVPKDNISYVFSEEDMTVYSSEITCDTYIVSDGDIMFVGEQFCGTGRVVLYSRYGDITISGENADIEGIIYAPEGCISITANDTNIIGRLIADTITCSGSVLNLTSSDDDLDILTGEPVPTEIITPTETDTPAPTSDVSPTETPSPTVIDENADSDWDGLTDIYELEIGTDPEDEDSDDDGLLDGDEVLIGKDPLDPSDGSTRIEQTFVKDINNEEDGFVTKVEVTTELAGYINRVLKVKDIYMVDVYVTDAVGRKGSPIEIICDENIDSATLTFYYDENLLGTTNENELGILWFDEEYGVFEMQDQAVVDVVNNKVTVELDHFSKYFLVDRKMWNEITPIPYDVIDPSDSRYDIMFAINVNDYIDSNERSNSYYATLHFTPFLREGDRVAVVLMYGQNQYVSSGIIDITDDNSMVSVRQFMDQNLFQNYYTSGTPSIGSIAYQMDSVFGGNDIGNRRMLVMVSDEHLTSYGNTLTQTMRNYKITPNYISSSSFSMVSDDAVLVVESNGGLYYDSYVANSIGLRMRINMGYPDDDYDGIPDYLESQGMMGANKKIYYSYPTTKYSDGDSLTDGEEMGQIIKITATESNGELYYNVQPDVPLFLTKFSDFVPTQEGVTFVFLVNSDPMNEDSDGDGLVDNVDSLRLKVNPKINIIICADTSDYYDFVIEKRRFEREFETRDMPYISFVVDSFLDDDCTVDTDLDCFVEIWISLQNIDADGIWNEKIQWVGVDNLVLIGHGAPDRFEFSQSPKTYVESSDIIGDGNNISQYLNTTIDTIDIEACNCGSVDDNNCLARVLASLDNVGEVYAWTGKTNYDYLLSGMHVGLDGSICVRYYTNALGETDHDDDIGDKLEFLFWEY